MVDKSIELYTAETLPEDRKQALLDAMAHIGYPVDDMTLKMVFKAALKLVNELQEPEPLSDFWKAIDASRPLSKDAK